MPEGPLVACAHDGRRLIVAAADPAARAAGIQAGMPLAHARALHPTLTVRDAEPDADATALAELAAWCLRYTPLAAPDPPDGLWLDATGCAHLLGSEAAVLADIAARLARAGLTCRTAIADTPGAAWAMARHGEGGVIPPGQHPQALDPLPLAALRLAPETIRALRRLGIETVAALRAMPRAPLARRLGPAPTQRLDQALGHAPEPLTPLIPPDAIAHRLAFLEPLSTAEALATAIDALLATLCTRLAEAGQGARRLDLFCERLDGTTQAIAIGTARPVRDPAHLARLLREHIERIDPGEGIEAMRLLASRTDPLAATQLIALSERGDPELEMLVDVLENRFGPTRVYRCAPHESDVPERAVHHRPALSPPSAAWPANLPRPIRLLPRPQPVEALSLLPDQPPVAFTWRRQRRRIRRADGPERIFGEWWHRDAETAAVRDYWTVEDEEGRRYWLFRRGDGEDPTTGDLSWYLHGIF